MAWGSVASRLDAIDARSKVEGHRVELPVAPAVVLRRARRPELARRAAGLACRRRGLLRLFRLLRLLVWRGGGRRRGAGRHRRGDWRGCRRGGRFLFLFVGGGVEDVLLSTFRRWRWGWGWCWRPLPPRLVVAVHCQIDAVSHIVPQRDFAGSRSLERVLSGSHGCSERSEVASRPPCPSTRRATIDSARSLVCQFTLARAPDIIGLQALCECARTASE